MSGDACPVCGHDGTACRPAHSQIITTSGVRDQVGPVRVPRQRSRIGRPGYVGEGTGKIELYDPEYPSIRLVDPKADEAAQAALSAPAEAERAPGCDLCGSAVGELHGDECRYHGRVSELAAKRRRATDDKRLEGSEDKSA